MIVVYTQDPEKAAEIVRHLGGFEPVAVFRLEEVDRMAGRCPCGVLLAANSLDGRLADHARLLLDRHLWTSWIILTDRARPNPGWREELAGRAVLVWLEEAERELAPAVARAAEAAVESWLPRLVEGAKRLPAELGLALLRAFPDAGPPRSVAGLSKAANLPEARLRYLWSAAIPSPGPTPGELVEWLQVVGALQLRRRGVSWKCAAEELRVSDKRLRAVFRRRTGLCPKEAWDRGPEEVRGLLARWWAQAQLG